MAVCIRVPKTQGEAVRSRLMSEGRLDLGSRIRSDGDFLLIPVVGGPIEGYESVEADVGSQERRSTDYREVAEVPEELKGFLPSSFDVVGDVAMIKLPEELLPYKEGIGSALMSVNRSIRTVFLDSGVKGEYRVRDLERIAGSGPSETVHKEFGVRLWTDPAKVYFNPRLSSERARIASQVKDGEVVIDMFAGVAPFGTVICRLARPEAVYSIDLNPEAERFARINAEKNHADRLRPMTGDSSELVYSLPMADRIIMNLPQIADRFLRFAMDRLKVGGVAHMYKIIEREAFPGFCDGLVSGMSEIGFGIRIESSELKTYSPTMSVYSLDIFRES
ncbi:MAG: class I SAM-dependent methyltransferase family protein [Candidatus Methanomethylophilaceae archaeon]|nr:class I SAM-dependent methyltransferase family protein [Candidatus Methanomethylophilaceae archaeon]